MASTYKILGQSNPAATTNTDLYTVPSSTSAVVSTLSIANVSSTSTTYRVLARQGGAATATKQYIAYDATIAGNDTITMTLGVTLATTDVITVYGGTATLAFNLFGSEIT